MVVNITIDHVWMVNDITLKVAFFWEIMSRLNLFMYCPKLAKRKSCYHSS